MSEYSLSQLNAYQKCKYLWQLTYGRGITPVRRARPLALGSLIHAGLAASLGGKDPVEALDLLVVTHNAANAASAIQPQGEVFVVEEEVDVDALKSQAHKIVERAIQFLSDNGDWETVYVKDTPLIETKLKVQFPVLNLTFTGVVDWVAREKNTDTLWLFDHKTRVRLQPDDSEDYNVQMALYQKLLWSVGVRTAGSICFQIRSALPAIPKRNMNGTMSRADLATDWDTYTRHLKICGLDPSDYLDMQAKLEGKEFFRLSKSYRSDDLVEAIWHSNIVKVVGDIRYSKQMYDMNNTDAPRNMHSVNCKLCASRDWCQAELRNLDTDWLIEIGAFQKGQPR